MDISPGKPLWGVVGPVLKSVLGKVSFRVVGWPQAVIHLGRPAFPPSLPLPTPEPGICFPAPLGSRQLRSPASRQGPRISSWKLNSYSMGLDTSVSRRVDRHSLFQESRARLPKQCLSLLGRRPGGGGGEETQQDGSAGLSSHTHTWQSVHPHPGLSDSAVGQFT